MARFIVVLLAACSLAAAADNKRYVTEVNGKELFLAHCASCHGPDGKGAGPTAAALKTKPTDLTRLSRQNKGKFPYDAVERTILGASPLAPHGSREMPVWGPAFSEVYFDRDLSKVRVKNVTEFIASLQVK
ncbi:MAG: cytochrome c [Bryobacteraceae bacterium]